MPAAIGIIAFNRKKTIRKDVFVYFRKKVFIVFTRIENALFIVPSVIHVIDIALNEIHRKLLVRFSRGPRQERGSPIKF